MKDVQKGRKSWLERLTSPPEDGEDNEQYDDRTQAFHPFPPEGDPRDTDTGDRRPDEHDGQDHSPEHGRRPEPGNDQERQAFGTGRQQSSRVAGGEGRQQPDDFDAAFTPRGLRTPPSDFRTGPQDRVHAMGRPAQRPGTFRPDSGGTEAPDRPGFRRTQAAPEGEPAWGGEPAQAPGNGGFGRHDAERSEADRPQDERSAAEHLDTERDHAERPDTERPGTERDHAERNDTERDHAQRNATESDHAERPDTERPDTERDHAERPDTERPGTERDHAERNDLDRPAGQFGGEPHGRAAVDHEQEAAGGDVTERPFTGGRAESSDAAAPERDNWTAPADDHDPASPGPVPGRDRQDGPLSPDSSADSSADSQPDGSADGTPRRFDGSASPDGPDNRDSSVLGALPDTSDVPGDGLVSADPRGNDQVNGSAEWDDAERRRRIDDLQQRWLDAQAKLLDDPRDAAHEAGLLVGEAMVFVTSTFTERRDRIEREWRDDTDLGTDELLSIMRRYRSLFRSVLAASEVPEDRR